MRGQARWFMPVVILMLVFILPGCSYTEQSASGEMPEMIRVKLMMPDQAKVNEEVALQIKLTQGEKPVNDADHVQFQIWNEQNEPAAPAAEQGMMNADELEARGAVKASAVGDGVYEVRHTFQEPGVYVVQAHVTSGAMHTMPRAKVTVE
ncbi:FixH family protein [Paenibacillus barcinonensis]|uniref:FixH family protein n=1 Tax=Paenibacillus barcinonensis TaxID=198119 RepID=A0A2V4VV99_PAEBA|nr:FixH family protein [Paenibacillus barcinonensis]PYE42785.1 YtkA-like protein [Paenibacillus barcinonensis]QKS57155.1 FixH family protein [Paenibacillus barcinonensis]